MTTNKKQKTIARKTFFAALGACASGTLGLSLALFGATLLVVVPGLVGTAALFTYAAHTVVHRSDVFRNYRKDEKRGIIAWLTAAAVANAAFVLFWVVNPQLGALWAVCVAVLAVAEYFIATSVEWVHNHPRENHTDPYLNKQERAQRQEEARAASSRPEEEMKFRRALDDLGKELVQIVDWDPIGGNEPFGMKYTCRRPSKGSLKNSSASAGSASLGQGDAEDIAIEMGRRLGQHLGKDWVKIKEESGAGVVSVTVTTEDIFNRLNPFTDDTAPVSITDPAPIATGVDGLLFHLLLAQHGKIVGKTGSGKTSMINVIIAYILRCHDAVLWVCGTHKLVETMGPWVTSYEGTGRRHPINWIANGAQDTANMLAAAMMVSDWRQSLRPDDPRRAQAKSLVVLLDEASFALEVQRIYAKYRGAARTPSELASNIVRTGFSAGVYLLVASQRGTNGEWGTDGGTVNSNVGYTAVFKTEDQAEVGRQMGINNYQLPAPTHKGEMWLKSEEAPERLKAPYVREENPAKGADKLLRKFGFNPDDYPSEGHIAWSRRDHDNDLDEGSQQAAGPHYATRITDPDKLMAYLAGESYGAPAAEPKPASTDTETEDAELAALTPAGKGEAEAQRIIDEIMGRTPSASTTTSNNTDTDASAAASGADNVTNISPRIATAQRETIDEAIVAVLDSADGPLGTSDIHAALQQRGHNVSNGSVSNALTRVLKAGSVERPAKGVYQPVRTAATV